MSDREAETNTATLSSKTISSGTKKRQSATHAPDDCIPRELPAALRRGTADNKWRSFFFPHNKVHSRKLNVEALAARGGVSLQAIALRLTCFNRL